MRKVFAIAAIAVIVLISIFFLRKTRTPGNDSANWKIYDSKEWGLNFAYPPNYYLEEKELGNGERRHHFVELTENTEENRAVREGRAPGREGPVSITINVYQNNLDHYEAERWIKSVNDSNYKLSPDGEIAYSVIGGEGALAYRWSGLYEADAIVVARLNNVYMFTNTYIAPEDQIRKDFQKIITTVKFQ